MDPSVCLPFQYPPEQYSSIFFVSVRLAELRSAMPPRFLSFLLLVLVRFATETEADTVNQSEASLDTGSNYTYALPVQVVQEFPTATWIENIAVRSNGQILATEDGEPRIYQIDPFSGSPDQKPTLLHEFNDTASILGIVEASPDVFYVCTGNYSSKLLQGYGEAYIYQLDMRNFSPSIPGSAPNISKYIAAINVAFNNTYTQSTGFGVNGIKVSSTNGEDFLYFTNSQQQTVIKVPIAITENNVTGQATVSVADGGDYTVLAQGGGDNEAAFEPDDLAIDADGDAYVTSFAVGKNGLVFVPREGSARNGSEITYIANIAGPTACNFGRTETDRNILYVSTSGGDYDYLTGEPVTVNGKIVAIEVGRNAR